MIFFEGRCAIACKMNSMAHGALIQTLAAALGLALLLGFVAARLRVPALVGMS